MAKLRLRESILAGPVLDTLEIEEFDYRTLLRNDFPAFNPVLIMSFLEGVLGYQFVGDYRGTLMYRRDRPFE